MNSPLRLGDQLSLRLLTSDRKQRLLRRLPGAGRPALTRLGLNVSNMRYALGHDFEILEAHGSARTTGIFMQQPLITGRHFRLEARLQYEDRQLRDDIDMFSQRHAKRIRLGTASLSANGEDSLFGGAAAPPTFPTAMVPCAWKPKPSASATRAERSAGGFGKLNLTLLRLQHLYGPFTLYGRSAPSARPRTSTVPNSSAWAAPTACAPTPTAPAAATRAGRPRSNCATCPWPACNSRLADAGRVQLSQRPWTDERNQRRLSAAGLSITQARRIRSWPQWPGPSSAKTNRTAPSRNRAWLRATRYF